MTKQETLNQIDQKILATAMELVSLRMRRGAVVSQKTDEDGNIIPPEGEILSVKTRYPGQKYEIPEGYPGELLAHLNTFENIEI